METSGFLDHYWSLSDVACWRFMRRITGMSQPPPQDTLWRCVNFPNFAIKVGAGWNKVSVDDGAVAVEMPKGRMTFDFLICGTAFYNTSGPRPQLAALSHHIATWNDVFYPAAGRGGFLPGGCAVSRVPPSSFWRRPRAWRPVLGRIHNFTYGATLSMGLSASSISGMKDGLPRLIRGVVGDLFREDADRHF